VISEGGALQGQSSGIEIRESLSARFLIADNWSLTSCFVVAELRRLLSPQIEFCQHQVSKNSSAGALR